LKNENIPIIFGQTYELLQHAKAAVVNSGTATLETALIGTPQAVVYHVPGGRLGYLVKIIVVKLNFISLVNIIAGKEVVKELIAHLFTVEKVTKELDLILNNDAYRQKMISRYSELKKELGEGGAAKRAAEKMIQLLSD
jgi:lipid-A-disaccharide synthase